MHPHTKSVVEIDSFMFEPVFYRNFIYDLNFAEYIVSSGHLSPKLSLSESKKNCYFVDYADFAKKGCKIERKRDPKFMNKATQDWIVCQPSYHTRHCDTWVNVTILKTHMDTLFYKSLCRSGAQILEMSSPS